jgi:hypothetical protein
LSRIIPTNARGAASMATCLVACALAATGCRREAATPASPAVPSSEPSPPATRPHVAAFLRMPPNDRGPIPPRLSETGAFADVRTLEPTAGLLPYEVNVPFWSDGAGKRRWVAVPYAGEREPPTIRFAATGPWTFPAGTVFVKHFERLLAGSPATEGGRPAEGQPADPAHPRPSRRLETRLLVRDDAGGVYGASYRWRPDGSDADLVTDGHQEVLKVIATRQADRPDGAARAGERPWYFPGPADCRVCHTAAAGLVLGVNARQLNRPGPPPPGGDAPPPAGPLVDWNRLRLFSQPLSEAAIVAIPMLAPADDPGVGVEVRTRSYLDANCAHCHRPGGAPGTFDARFETPLAAQNLVGGRVLIDLGVDRARVIAPNDVWWSTLLSRLTTLEQPKMPPLAHEALDARGAALIRQWVLSLPGPAVVAPPTVDPPGGTFATAVRVRLRHDDPAAVVRYTLDGSVPDGSSAVYREPLELARPTTVRAKAFKDGATRSVTAQQTFVVGD